MSSYPRSFQYFLSRLNGFSRQKYRVLTQAQTTFGPSSQLIVSLPVGLLDLSTLTMHGSVLTSGTGGGSALPPAEMLIDALTVEMGGVNVQSLTEYGRLFSVFRDYQLADRASFRQVLQLDPVDGTAAPGAHVNSRPFCIWNWLGLLGSVKVLDTTLLPQVNLYIRFAPVAAIAAAGATGVSYTLSDVSFTVDVLDIADGVFGPMIQQRLASAPLEVPYNNFTTVIGNTGAVGSSTRWSTSAHCLEGIIATALHETPDATYNTVTCLPRYFTRSGANIETAQFFVNGVPTPSIPLDNAKGDIFASTAHTMSVAQDVLGQSHPQMNTLAKWRANFFVHAHSFTYDDSEADRRLCGLDGRGNTIVGNWDLKGSGANVTPLLWLRHKSVMRVGTNRMIEIVL
jgi:hypothetical protein